MMKVVIICTGERIGIHGYNITSMKDEVSRKAAQKIRELIHQMKKERLDKTLQVMRIEKFLGPEDREDHLQKKLKTVTKVKVNPIAVKKRKRELKDKKVARMPTAALMTLKVMRARMNTDLNPQLKNLRKSINKFHTLIKTYLRHLTQKSEQKVNFKLFKIKNVENQ